MPEQDAPVQGMPAANRPEMPASYGIQAPESGSGLLPWSQVDERMATARNYWIGTTRPDGRPHTMPVWGLWLDGVFYFSTGRGSRKERNLTASPHLVVHLESGDDVVILEGVAKEIRDVALLTRYADAYEAKYQVRPDPGDVEGNVTYVLRPHVVFAWQESDFPGGATRWRFGGV